jgi:iron complex transport system substrate-binding protein
VKIKKPVKRCVVVFPQALPFFYMLKAQRCVVGYPGFGMRKTPFYSGNLILKVDPNFKKRVADVGYPKMINIEEIVKLKPNFAVNVMFAKITNQEMEKFRIPVLKVTFGFGNLKQFIQSVKIIGKATGKEKNAKKFINYYLKIVNTVKNGTKNLPKPKVLYLSYEGPKGHMLTSGGKFDTYIRNIINIAGGIDVSKNVPGFFGRISDEDILKWNPDVIILGSKVSPKILYDNPKLKFINAVKNKKIYILPFDGNTKYSNWFAPQESSLGILWLAKILHPKRFSNINLKKAAQKYYKTFWGLRLNQIKIQGNGLWKEK